MFSPDSMSNLSLTPSGSNRSCKMSKFLMHKEKLHKLQKDFGGEWMVSGQVGPLQVVIVVCCAIIVVTKVVVALYKQPFFCYPLTWARQRGIYFLWQGTGIHFLSWKRCKTLSKAYNFIKLWFIGKTAEKENYVNWMFDKAQVQSNHWRTILNIFKMWNNVNNKLDKATVLYLSTTCYSRLK